VPGDEIRARVDRIEGNVAADTGRKPALAHRIPDRVAGAVKIARRQLAGPAHVGESRRRREIDVKSTEVNSGRPIAPDLFNEDTGRRVIAAFGQQEKGNILQATTEVRVHALEELTEVVDAVAVRARVRHVADRVRDILTQQVVRVNSPKEFDHRAEDVGERFVRTTRLAGVKCRPARELCDAVGVFVTEHVGRGKVATRASLPVVGAHAVPESVVQSETVVPHSIAHLNVASVESGLAVDAKEVVIGQGREEVCVDRGGLDIEGQAVTPHVVRIRVRSARCAHREVGSDDARYAAVHAVGAARISHLKGGAVEDSADVHFTGIETPARGTLDVVVVPDDTAIARVDELEMTRGFSSIVDEQLDLVR
jgi:hypothetical protein